MRGVLGVVILLGLVAAGGGGRGRGRGAAVAVTVTVTSISRGRGRSTGRRRYAPMAVSALGVIVGGVVVVGVVVTAVDTEGTVDTVDIVLVTTAADGHSTP